MHSVVGTLYFACGSSPDVGLAGREGATLSGRLTAAKVNAAAPALAMTRQ